MFLVVGVALIAIMLVRGALRLAGYQLRPWLPAGGRRRYYADLLIAAPILLSVAIAAGLPESLGTALGVALLASLAAAGLEALRGRRTGVSPQPESDPPSS